MLISSAFVDFPCHEESLALRRGDVLLFYTDGVSEAQNADEMFGRDRIVALLASNGARGGTLLDGVLLAVSDFCGGRPPLDDMTLLAFEYPP
jgi:sigma-B regulation protein RsbU (phosphoserine phosphatase)